MKKGVCAGLFFLAVVNSGCGGSSVDPILGDTPPTDAGTLEATLDDGASQADAAPINDGGASKDDHSNSGQEGGAGKDAGPTQCAKTLVPAYPAGVCAPNYLNSAIYDSNGKGISAILTYPCAGGSAQVTFNGADFSGKPQTFTGTVDGFGNVSLQNIDPFNFNACVWQSTQTISGRLSAASLSYSYSEGSANCDTSAPCVDTATVNVF